MITSCRLWHWQREVYAVRIAQMLTTKFIEWHSFHVCESSYSRRRLRFSLPRKSQFELYAKIFRHLRKSGYNHFPSPSLSLKFQLLSQLIRKRIEYTAANVNVTEALKNMTQLLTCLKATERDKESREIFGAKTMKHKTLLEDSNRGREKKPETELCNWRQQKYKQQQSQKQRQ